MTSLQPTPVTSRSWVATPRSGMLAGRKRSDTRPEVLLRKALHKRGLRYRLQPKLGERLTADFAFPAARVAVFVDGCFWHRCPEHFSWSPRGANADLWRAKFERTAQRDRRADQLVVQRGWQPLRVWECAVVTDLDAAAERVAHVVRGHEVVPEQSHHGTHRPAGFEEGQRPWQ